MSTPTNNLPASSAAPASAAAAKPPLNTEEALSHLALARSSFAAVGDAAAEMVQELGYELFGKAAFDLGKKPYASGATATAREEGREEAKLQLLAAWAEFDTAGDENARKVVVLGWTLFGKGVFDEELRQFNEE